MITLNELLCKKGIIEIMNRVDNYWGELRNIADESYSGLCVKCRDIIKEGFTTGITLITNEVNISLKKIVKDVIEIEDTIYSNFVKSELNILETILIRNNPLEITLIKDEFREIFNDYKI